MTDHEKKCADVIAREIVALPVCVYEPGTMTSDAGACANCNGFGDFLDGRTYSRCDICDGSGMGS